MTCVHFAKTFLELICDVCPVPQAYTSCLFTPSMCADLSRRVTIECLWKEAKFDTCFWSWTRQPVYIGPNFNKQYRTFMLCFYIWFSPASFYLPYYKTPCWHSGMRGMFTFGYTCVERKCGGKCMNCLRGKRLLLTVWHVVATHSVPSSSRFSRLYCPCGHLEGSSTSRSSRVEECLGVGLPHPNWSELYSHQTSEVLYSTVLAR